MSIFAKKSTSIFAIQKKNKVFAEWWNGWVVRVQRTKGRVRPNGQNMSPEAKLIQFRNRMRLRSILQERGFLNGSPALRIPSDPLPDPTPMPSPEPSPGPIKEPEPDEPQIPDAPVREPEPPGPSQI
jgi:hypothetical protein